MIRVACALAIARHGAWLPELPPTRVFSASSADSLSLTQFAGFKPGSSVPPRARGRDMSVHFVRLKLSALHIVVKRCLFEFV